MKVLYIIILTLLFCSAAFAQDELIGRKKETVDSAMNAGKHKFLSTSITTDTKLPISTYRLTTGATVLFYYDADSICTMCALVSKRAELDAFIDELKKRYTEQDNGSWIRNDNKVKLTILKQQSIFAAKFMRQ